MSQITTVGVCDIELTVSHEGGKVDFTINCPTCNNLEGMITTDNCEIHTDLALETSKKY